MKKFKIANVSAIANDINIVGDKSLVSEKLFENKLTEKVKEITKDRPEKFEETLEKAKEFLWLGGNSLTVVDTWFKIERK